MGAWVAMANVESYKEYPGRTWVLPFVEILLSHRGKPLCAPMLQRQQWAPAREVDAR